MKQRVQHDRNTTSADSVAAMLLKPRRFGEQNGGFVQRWMRRAHGAIIHPGAPDKMKKDIKIRTQVGLSMCPDVITRRSIESERRE